MENDKPGSWVREFPFGKVRFLREQTRGNFVHAFDDDDVARTLRLVPEGDADGIRFVVFQQPTWKMDRHSPRWAAYRTDYEHRGEVGPVVFLVAVDPTRPMEWEGSLTPEDRRELDMLAAEGHEITRDRKVVRIGMDAESTRRTLERSFLHEIGHHVDHERDPEEFLRKTRAARELFADQYANRLIQAQRGRPPRLRI